MNLIDFATLSDAHSYFTSRNITKNEAVNHDTYFGVEEILKGVIERTSAKDIITADDKILMRSANAFNKIINGMLDDINIMDATAQYVLTLLVNEGSYTQLMRDNIEKQARIYPYASVTAVQLNQAKGIYTEKEVVNYTQGKNIKITLIDVLTENCVATTWSKENDFDYENMGKLAHLKNGNSIYKLRMDNKKVDGKLFVRIPLESFNFSVEVI